MSLGWSEIKAAVLAKEPKAGPILDILARYWGDGTLTEELATRFINFYSAGNYVEANKIIYAKGSAQQLIDADVAANAKLREMIDAEKKLYDFAGALESAVMKIALGAALAVVGL
jgi:hypothetical protein